MIKRSSESKNKVFHMILRFHYIYGVSWAWTSGLKPNSARIPTVGSNQQVSWLGFGSFIPYIFMLNDCLLDLNSRAL